MNIPIEKIIDAGSTRHMYLGIRLQRTDGTEVFKDNVLCEINETCVYSQIRFVDPPVYFHSRQTITISEPFECLTEPTNISTASPVPRNVQYIPDDFVC